MTPKTRTITLTDARPVRIREDHWPTIAHGVYDEHDGQIRCQANRSWTAHIRVRQNAAQGRIIVYGTYDYVTAFQGERGTVARAGELVENEDDIIPAIHRIGETLAEITGQDAHVNEAVRECIADLPARDLD